MHSRLASLNDLLCVGQTPLHMSAIMGHGDILRLLVNSKADVNVQDSKSGKTALHHSVERGDLAMTGYLVTEVHISSSDTIQWKYPIPTSS